MLPGRFIQRRFLIQVQERMLILRTKAIMPHWPWLYRTLLFEILISMSIKNCPDLSFSK